MDAVPPVVRGTLVSSLRPGSSALLSPDGNPNRGVRVHSRYISTTLRKGTWVVAVEREGRHWVASYGFQQ